MSFYPDGETRIPEQTPIPAIHAVTPEEQGRRRTRVLMRTAVINTVILAAAVVAAYVVPVSDDEDVALAIVLVAAMISASHMAFVILRDQRRVQEEQRAARLAAGDAPPATTSYGAVADAPATTTYGAVADAGGFTLTVEDVFSITGRGTVVTGRVGSGQARVGAQVAVVRDGRQLVTTEITGIEMFRRTVTVAEVGENVGLLLRGVTRSDLQRGDVLQG